MFLVSPLVTIHLKDKKADINARCYIIMCFFFFRSYKFSGMPLDPEYTENSIGCNILLKSELLWDGETTVCMMG